MSRRSQEKAHRATLAAGRPHPAPAPDPKAWLSDWVAGLVLVAAVLVAYQRVVHAGYIWDDDMHLTKNPCIVGPLGLREIWTTRAARICPLVLTTFWVEHSLWGLNPLPYHAVNVLLHAASALVLWRVLRRLGVIGAWLGAALWALHPVQVETVAWITELKNTQSCLFYLLAVLFFARWLVAESAGGPDRRPWLYALSLFCAGLAMASKSSTVILPLVLCLCAWWTEGRLRLRTVARVVPVFLMSAAASALTLWTQHLEGANDTEWVRSWPERIAVAGRVFWFYLGKLLWPHPLIFIYPRWTIDATQAASYLGTAALAASGFALWHSQGGRMRPAFFAFAYFLAALLPVLGIVDQYFLRYSFVGDHFQYLASMGPLALAAAAMTAGYRLLAKSAHLLGAGFAGLLLCLLCTLTWRQTAMYAGAEALWSATVAQNPECWLAHNNLGVIALQEGHFDAAAAHFEKALVVGPETAEAEANLGNALLKIGRAPDALPHLLRSIAIDPADARSQTNLGEAYRQTGKLDDALVHCQSAVDIDPGFAAAHTSLGNVLLQMNRLDDAASQYRRSLAIDSRNIEARTNLGTVFLQKGRVDDAVAEFQRVVDIAPGFAAANAYLGNALLREGRGDEAIAHFQKALEIEPHNAGVRESLGTVFLGQGRLDEAIAQLSQAVEADPASAQAHQHLGDAFLKAGRTDEAEAQFREALRLK
jgi:protein O-mannosyl-transferase